MLSDCLHLSIPTLNNFICFYWFAIFYPLFFLGIVFMYLSIIDMFESYFFTLLIALLLSLCELKLHNRSNDQHYWRYIYLTSMIWLILMSMNLCKKDLFWEDLDLPPANQVFFLSIFGTLTWELKWVSR